MTGVAPVLALIYACLLVALIGYERRRSASCGPDLVSLFAFVSALQVVVPGIIIYGALPFADPQSPTQNQFFDRVLTGAAPAAAVGVCLMTVWFYVAFYAAIGAARPLFRTSSGRSLDLRTSRATLVAVLVLGAGMTALAFWSLGDTMLLRYASLILFRDQFESVERTIFSANVFALTQSWTWLAVVLVFASLEPPRRRLLVAFAVALVVLFALLSVSRRAIFIPVLMSYMVVVLLSGKWHLRLLLIGALPVGFWLAFGKGILGAIAYGGTVEAVTGSYSTLTAGLIRTGAESGITMLESIATLSWLDVGPRLGIDHFMAALKLLPEGALGLDFNYPERIVRISTTAFLHARALDIPPGLMGQMWIDFGILGPLLWGVALGLQVALLQSWWTRIRPRRGAAAVAVVALFIVALPVNTGSYDFTFSIDIVIVVLVLLLVSRRVAGAVFEPPARAVNDLRVSDV